MVVERARRDLLGDQPRIERKKQSAVAGGPTGMAVQSRRFDDGRREIRRAISREDADRRGRLAARTAAQIRARPWTGARANRVQPEHYARTENNRRVHPQTTGRRRSRLALYRRQKTRRPSHRVTTA